MGCIVFGEGEDKWEEGGTLWKLGVEEKKKQNGKLRILQDKREWNNWNTCVTRHQQKTKQNHTKISALIEENVLKIVSELWDTLKIPFTKND